MTEYKLALTTSRCCGGPAVCERYLVKGFLQSCTSERRGRKKKKKKRARTHPHLEYTHKTASSKLYLTHTCKLIKGKTLNWALTHTHTHTFEGMLKNESFRFWAVCVSSRAEGLLNPLLSCGFAASPEKNRLQPHASLSSLMGFKVPLISPSSLCSASLVRGPGVLMFEVRAGAKNVSHCERLFSCCLTL